MFDMKNVKEVVELSDEHDEGAEIENQKGNGKRLDFYKGIYFNVDNEENYYEAGAHFKYEDLYRKLELLMKELSPERLGSPNPSVNHNLISTLHPNSNVHFKKVKPNNLNCDNKNIISANANYGQLSSRKPITMNSIQEVQIHNITAQVGQKLSMRKVKKGIININSSMTSRTDQIKQLNINQSKSRNISKIKHADTKIANETGNTQGHITECNMNCENLSTNKPYYLNTKTNVNTKNWKTNSIANLHSSKENWDMQHNLGSQMQNTNQIRITNVNVLSCFNEKKSRNSNRKMPESLTKYHAATENEPGSVKRDLLTHKFLSSTLKNEPLPGGKSKANGDKEKNLGMNTRITSTNNPNNQGTERNKKMEHKMKNSTINTKVQHTGDNKMTKTSYTTPNKNHQPKFLTKNSAKKINNPHIVNVNPTGIFSSIHLAENTNITSQNCTIQNSATSLNHNKKVLIDYNGLYKSKFIFNKKEVRSNTRTLKFLLLNPQCEKKELSLSKDGNNSFSLSKEKSSQLLMNSKLSKNGSIVINLSNTNNNTNSNMFNSSINESKCPAMINPNNSKNTNVNSYYNTSNTSHNLRNSLNVNSSTNNSSNPGNGNVISSKNVAINNVVNQQINSMLGLNNHQKNMGRLQNFKASSHKK